ncbi:MAG TPA: type II secretion system protein GspJ [Kofleriaceae bacterium]|nr:type II secretion system protein GspJ [Kofleriaceae bacterium]
MTTPRRRPQAGLTLMEVLIATAILATMMMLTWRTVSGTSQTRRTFEASEERNHELRMALDQVVRDFEAAYLSKNEDQSASHPRTMMIARPTSKAPEIRFSTMGHRVLWADANESEQTVVSYLTRTNPENKSAVDWIRREQRRPSYEPPENEPAEYDVLVHDIQTVKIEFWNWKNFEWQDTWDTTQADGQKNWLPSRVRITITVKGPGDKDYKVTSQARILLQEPLNFVQSGT